MTRGSLTVVGTGIRMGVHLTPEAHAAIVDAEEFLYLGTDGLSEKWLSELHPRSSTLQNEYAVGEQRHLIYERMVERILVPVRGGRRVAVAFYGHPGVYVTPSHEAIRRARAEGHEARMLPAVSAEDCLLADLNVDPGTDGFASYDATNFLVRPPLVDTSSGLVLWQICVVGDPTAVAGFRLDNLRVLMERLLEHYPADHEVIVYEASPYPVVDAHVDRVPLGSLVEASLTPMSTLYVPPAREREFDHEMAVKLGFSTH